jgi:hypothetical protein
MSLLGISDLSAGSNLRSPMAHGGDDADLTRQGDETGALAPGWKTA